MRLATRRDRTRDGTLLVEAQGGWAAADAIASSLRDAIERWADVEARLRDLATGRGEPIDLDALTAPLPRTWQWLDGSAFPQHGELMQKAYNLPPIKSDKPLMYQGLSDIFLGPRDDVPLPSEDDGIDFEGEFGVIVDDVPMGVSADDALDHVKLVIQINDWSLRTIAPVEMKTGFGWVQAKPACSAAPFAVTPDALGAAWRNGRIHLPLTVQVNGAPFGRPHGGEMAYGFHELIAHAARTRALPAGTIIGSGTVSNRDYARLGSTCISERRAIEMIHDGSPSTNFLSFGDRVRMFGGDDADASPFGIIDQAVVRAG